MEIWLDSTAKPTSSLPEGASRIWDGSASDVAEVALDDYRGQDEARSLVGVVNWILVRCSDWTMIPLENIVAAAAGSGTRVAAVISREVDLPGAAFALQHGVDAVLLPPESDSQDLWNAARKLASKEGSDDAEKPSSQLSTATVTSVESGGVGERICVDLIERMSLGEGMAIGSSSTALCLVHGETIPSEYVPSRPFRVNAGAVHAYALMADNSTKYLSELNVGDKVAVVTTDGTRRSASVGRLKIERRPFLIVKFECDSMGGQIMTQQVETVRLVSPSGEAVSVTELQSGDQILVRVENSMRHIGQALHGEVNER
ncbi:MAG: 3-dehydroquinate synthase II [Candidatus Poseidoniales archaeon]|nr:MAG: 3-dehydroquinate synthase II [Candidatus Poseidoniales archaeon]